MAQIRNGRIESRLSYTYDAFVRITPGEEYPIYVCNGNVSKTVTSNNCDDVFGDDTVKYSNENKILTFNGNGSLSSNNDFLLTSEVNELTVGIDKDTTITQMDLYGITILREKESLLQVQFIFMEAIVIMKLSAMIKLIKLTISMPAYRT